MAGFPTHTGASAFDDGCGGDPRMLFRIEGMTRRRAILCKASIRLN
jgi:hypothetical protein